MFRVFDFNDYYELDHTDCCDRLPSTHIFMINNFKWFIALPFCKIFNFLEKVTFLSLKLIQPLHVFYRIIYGSVDIKKSVVGGLTQFAPKTSFDACLRLIRC